MNPADPEKQRRVDAAAEAVLSARGYVRPVDVLLGMGWLDPTSHKRWETGQVPSLESVIYTKPTRVAAAMTRLRDWAGERGLIPSVGDYVARSPGRPALQFTTSGDPAAEEVFRTHWISPALSEKKRQQVEEKANKKPELVVISARSDWNCHRCKGTGGLLIMEPPGPSCLQCAGLGSLEFLESGDARLTRRAKAGSSVWAVVVRFSRSRRRYERQGLLVEPEALRAARAEASRFPPLRLA